MICTAPSTRKRLSRSKQMCGLPLAVSVRRARSSYQVSGWPRWLPAGVELAEGALGGHGHAAGDIPLHQPALEVADHSGGGLVGRRRGLPQVGPGVGRGRDRLAEAQGRVGGQGRVDGLGRLAGPEEAHPHLQGPQHGESVAHRLACAAAEAPGPGVAVLLVLVPEVAHRGERRQGLVGVQVALVVHALAQGGLVQPLVEQLDGAAAVARAQVPGVMDQAQGEVGVAAAAEVAPGALLAHPDQLVGLAGEGVGVGCEAGGDPVVEHLRREAVGSL